MKKIYIVSFTFLLAAGCTVYSPAETEKPSALKQNPYTQPLMVGGKKIFVQIVENDIEMQTGLSGREKLTDEQGMLFDFKTSKPVIFWMKDMKFDLDLIWITNKKIVGITNDVPAPKNPDISDASLPRYSSPTNVDMVLEVNSGWAKKYEIKTGDTISY